MCEYQFVRDHRSDLIIGDEFEFVDFVRGAESVEEVNEGDA